MLRWLANLLDQWEAEDRSCHPEWRRFAEDHPLQAERGIEAQKWVNQRFDPARLPRRWARRLRHARRWAAWQWRRVGRQARALWAGGFKPEWSLVVAFLLGCLVALLLAAWRGW